MPGYRHMRFNARQYGNLSLCDKATYMSVFKLANTKVPRVCFSLCSHTSLIRSSAIRIPRHPEENCWLPMCRIRYAYNITSLAIRIPVHDFVYKLIEMCAKSFVVSGCMWLAEAWKHGVVQTNEVLDLLAACG